jgi:hypothetical protein
MSRVAAKIELSPEETGELNRWIKSGKTEQRKGGARQIVLRSAEGKPTNQIAKELGTATDQGEQVAQAFRSAEAGLSLAFEELRAPAQDSFDLLEPKDGRIFERYSKVLTIDLESIVGNKDRIRGRFERRAHDARTLCENFVRPMNLACTPT